MSVIALCRTCRHACYEWLYEAGTGIGTVEILDSGWSHFVHPADDHEAAPMITDWETLLEQLRHQHTGLAMLTCPYYQQLPGGTCRNSGCWHVGEPTCMTCEPAGGWPTPAGRTPERLKAEAARRQREEPSPA